VSNVRWSFCAAAQLIMEPVLLARRVLPMLAPDSTASVMRCAGDDSSSSSSRVASGLAHVLHQKSCAGLVSGISNQHKLARSEFDASGVTIINTRYKAHCT
jgi:hypothetical protein